MDARALLVLTLLLPAAQALHVDARDLSGEVESGARIILVLDARTTMGSVASGPIGPDTTLSHTFRHSARWGGTIEFEPGGRTSFTGIEVLRGEGSGALREEVRSPDGGWTRTCDIVQKTAEGWGSAHALIDSETRELHVLLTGLMVVPEDECVTTYSNGRTERMSYHPAPPVAPLFWQTQELLAEGDARLLALQPELTPHEAAHSVFFTLPLGGEQTFRGRTQAEQPLNFGTTHLSYACPGASVPGTCTATSVLHVSVVVEPCKFLRASYATHLAAVNALVKPPPGSSESQARSFQSDARHRVSALFADERNLQLLCGGEGADGDTYGAAAAANKKVQETWADVAKSHGLSTEGKRDLVAAERARHLLGDTTPPSPEIAEIIAAVVTRQGEFGRIVLRYHSPVVVHAWDPEGRHVGWNDTTGAPESHIEGANYTGQPGGAQELDLPSGLYKIAVVELGEGTYTYATEWNGTDEGVDLLPLAAKPGRTLVTNVLLDQHGILQGRAQRIGSEATTSTFVEAWAPLATEPRFRDADEAHGDDDPGAEGEGGSQGVPLPGVLAVGALLVAGAWRRRRG